MQLNSFSQQIVYLNSQNQQLKAKYKKSLHELMHILSINKTMKQHMDKCSNNQMRINQLQFSVEDLNIKLEMQKIRIKQVVCIKSGLQARVATLQLVNKDMEIEKQKLKNQLAQSLKKVKLQEEKRKQLQDKEQVGKNKIKSSQEMEQLKIMNEKLSKAVLKYRGIQNQNLKLSNKIEELQEEIKLISNQQNDQRQRWKKKISVLEDEVTAIRSSQLHKTRQLQYKYSILQAQISSYQQVQDYIEESQKIDQDQILFKSIQQQIQKISQNLSIYQNQNKDLIIKSREDQVRIKNIAELQSQIQKHRLESQHYKQKAVKLQLKVQEINLLQEKLKMASAQKLQLLQRNNVLQAIIITNKHRLGYEVSEKIEEFQRNINLLLQQDVKSMSNMGGIQQIIVLKGYLKELSQLLQTEKKKVDKLRKKNEQLKARAKDIQFQNTLKTNEFDKKITNYEQLIEKQYALLEQKILETQNMEKQRDYSNAISKYEQKILKMSDEIIKLKRKNESLQQINKSKVQPVVPKQEFQKLSNVIATLQKELERIQTKNTKLLEENKSLLESSKNEDNQVNTMIKEKEQKIAAILSKNAWYQEEIKSKQQKINQYIEMNKSYEKQMKALHEQLQQHVATNNYLHNKYKDTDVLLEQVANLETEINKLKRSQQAVMQYQSSKIVEHLQQLENKIILQTQQIDAYKQENTYIYNELQSSKQDKQLILLQHKSIVTELKSKIVGLQETMKEENILRKQQQQQISKFKQQCEKLKQQNKTLVLQIQTLGQQMQTKRLAFNNQIKNLKTAKQESQSQQSHPKLLHKSSKQIKQFNSKLLSLRTQNLAMKNELQEKEAIINELKHQIYTLQFKMQKHKSRQNLFIGRQQSEKNNQEYEKLLVAFTLVSAQLDAIRMRQATAETEVHTIEDHVIQKDFQHQINQKNITSLDYQQNEGKTKIDIVAQPLNMEVQTIKSIYTINQPISVIDNKWKQQQTKNNQKYQPKNGIKDYHISAGSFKMIKMLKKSLKSIEDGSGKKGESFNKQ